MNREAKKPSWTCSHGHAFSELELEMGMSMATMDYLMEQQEREHSLEADRATEAELARNYAAGKTHTPWPWYADPPTDEEAPEGFER